MTYHTNNHSNTLLVFVSDNTGVASETFGLTIMSQLGDYSSAQCETLPFVRGKEDGIKHINLINDWKREFKEIIVFSTFSDESMREVFKNKLTVPFFDLFELTLPKISSLLEKSVVPIMGYTKNKDKKEIRASAIDYALAFDDGQELNFDEADIILLGLSRSGKTPTALWLALHYGLKAANYPLTEDDFIKNKLPESLDKNMNKCVLLLQSPQRLSEIRGERYKNSKYASLENCKKELLDLDKIMEKYSIPKIDVSNKSIEEISANALMLTNIHPRGRF